jgi:HSP20 family protein
MGRSDRLTSCSPDAKVSLQIVLTASAVTTIVYRRCAGNLDSKDPDSNIFGRSATRAAHVTYGGVVMVMGYADPFETLFAFQRALENRLSSDWLGTTTAGTGSYPPINVFQQGDDLVAIVELPGVNKEDLNIQAKENTIRIAGRKEIDYGENVSLHRRERLSGVFDRTLVVPMQIDPDRIKAEYNDGLLALFIPRAERDKPRNIQIS